MKTLSKLCMMSLVVGFLSLTTKSYAIRGMGTMILPQEDPMSNTAVMVVLDVKTLSSCTGMLISPDLVLTAAHCLQQLYEQDNHQLAYTHPPEKTFIHFGGFSDDVRENLDINDGRWTQVSDIQIHPDYKPSIQGQLAPESIIGNCVKNDIALIKISAPKDLLLKPSPIKLLKPDVLSKSSTANQVRLFGLSSGQALGNLRAIDQSFSILPSDSPGQCLKIEWPSKKQADGSYSQQTGEDGEYVGLQVGDSGGGAVMEINGEKYLAGIDSMGSGYGYVPYFYDWIIDTANEMNAAPPSVLPDGGSL